MSAIEHDADLDVCLRGGLHFDDAGGNEGVSGGLVAAFTGGDGGGELPFLDVADHACFEEFLGEFAAMLGAELDGVDRARVHIQRVGNLLDGLAPGAHEFDREHLLDGNFGALAGQFTGDHLSERCGLVDGWWRLQGLGGFLAGQTRLQLGGAVERELGMPRPMRQQPRAEVTENKDRRVNCTDSMIA